MKLLTLLLIHTSTTTIHVSTITVSILAEWNAVTLGDDLVEREQRYRALDYSVKFLLNLDNYAAQQLTVSQSIITSGVIADDAKDIGPGLREAMSGHKTGWTATGVHGVVSWKIGDTGKMVVVMYDVPYDHLLYINTLAVGIFPQGDISGHYDIMYSGVEDGFQRITSGQASEELWFGDDPDYAIKGTMDETSDAGIQVKQQKLNTKTFHILIFLGESISKV